MERLQLGQDWFLVFSGQHHVDPIIFVAVNQAAILFFFASLYWLFKNMTKKKSIIIPTLLIGFFFISTSLSLLSTFPYGYIYLSM
ncbi:hypothetical protein ACVWYG_001219 [Pedobacter sp. UYEF25]